MGSFKYILNYDLRLMLQFLFIYFLNLAEHYKLASGNTGEKDCYFFTPRDRRYPNGERPSRAAGIGYWKASGADKIISNDKVVFGYRKSLVFYIGKSPKGVKTNWLMHEYRYNGPARKRTCSGDMKVSSLIPSLFPLI